uniref:Uncharacterized protein n=1 Tax=Anguilla anguilla TaxID=7936 RepID=A0A0E9SF30_ANGAN
MFHIQQGQSSDPTCFCLSPYSDSVIRRHAVSV